MIDFLEDEATDPAVLDLRPESRCFISSLTFKEVEFKNEDHSEQRKRPKRKSYCIIFISRNTDVETRNNLERI